MKSFKYIIVVALAVFAVSGNSYAEPSDSLALNRQLDSSMVLGYASGFGYWETIPAQTLGGKELERLNTLSVADAMRFFSGVQIKDYGGIGGLKTVNVRSLGTNHTAVLIDGIQIGNAQNGQVDLGRFSLDEVAEISLYNGQKSDIFQSAGEFGASSVVCINTSRPRFDDGRKFKFKASLKGGSFDLVNPSFRAEYKISDNVSGNVSAGFVNASGKYKFRCRGYDSRGNLAYDTTAFRRNGDVCALRTEAAFYGALRHGSWTLKAYNYHSDRGIPGAVVSNVFTNGERMRDNNLFVQGRAVNSWTPWWRSMFNAKFAYDYTFYEDKDMRRLYVSNTYRQKELFASCANLFSITDFWDVSLSCDFKWNYLDADNYMSGNLPFPQPVRFTEMVSAATALDLGRLKMQASLLGYFIHDKARKNSSDSRRSKAAPALYASYKVLKNNDLFVRAFAKSSFRMPTFNDLYYTNSASASLRPETVWQANAGFTYSGNYLHAGPLRKLNLSADGYWNKVKDKIIAYPSGQQFRWTMLNLGTVDIKGVDASCDAFFSFGPVETAVKLQYTWQKAVDVTDPDDTFYKNQIPYVPKHSGSAVASIYYKGWGLNYSFIYTGERYSHKENTWRNYVLPWYTSDLSLQKTLNINKKTLKATAEINNLFGQDYEVVLNYPMPKTNFRLSVSIEL